MEGKVDLGLERREERRKEKKKRECRK